MFVRYQQVSRIINLVKPASIVEIGTWNGDHAIVMATAALKNREKVHYRGFDLFEDASATTDKTEFNVRSHHSIDAVRAKLSAFRDKNPGFSFELVQGDTRQTLPDLHADFAYIDGGHSVETIASDYAHLRNCGTIVFDDYYDFDELGNRADISAVGCNRLLETVPHVLLPAFDALPSGGRVRMAGAGQSLLKHLGGDAPSRNPGKLRRAVVTTFSATGYYDYAKRFIETFARFWPSDVSLNVYSEVPLDPPGMPNVRIVNMLAACPDLVEFKARHVSDPRAHGILAGGGEDYRFNAVKFCHKVFALTHAALNIDADILYWIDADGHTFAPVTHGFLDTLLPDGCYTSYLGRRNMHSECGFMAFDLRHAQNRSFMEFWREIYAEDLIFQLPEWHDSYVYDVARKFYEQKDLIASFDLRASAPDDHHPFVNSPLGTCLDHLIGPRRKLSGSSYALDLRPPREEPYWQIVPWVAEDLMSSVVQSADRHSG